MTDLPIACTLTPDEMTARLALIDALAADGLLDRTTTESGLRGGSVTRRRSSGARELSAAESKCCAFLDFSVDRGNGDLVLDIAGPADACPVIEMFFAAEAA